MRKLTTLAIAAAMCLPFAANAGEWSGKLVDTRCMAMDTSNTGNDHKGGEMKGCATACAKMGIPVALLVDGKMHVLAAPAANFADYMAQDVTITGKDFGGWILPEKAVTADGQEINVGGMM